MKITQSMFLPTPRRGTPNVEIGGSILRYVSQPGQMPHADETGTSRDKFWRNRRIEVAKGSRIR